MLKASFGTYTEMKCFGGCFILKKTHLEIIMAGLLLAAFYLLSKEAADVFTTIEDEKRIVIDAGHGGEDPGVIGINGLKEKDINLQIAVGLKEELEKMGYQIFMMREKDTGLYEQTERNKKAIDMQNRIAFIKEKKPVLTISIHQNSYPEASVRGPQVFYYEDSVQGALLAKYIQEQLNRCLEVEHPRIAKGNKSYYLLKRSPGVLNIVECGFLTNPQESELLQEKEYQNRIIKAIAAGVEQYLQEK